jgi:hypothetical protein
LKAVFKKMRQVLNSSTQCGHKVEEKQMKTNISNIDIYKRLFIFEYFVCQILSDVL